MPSYVVSGANRGLGFEFVNQLSQSSDNTLFALVRSKKTADKLHALGRQNVHVLEADITDVKALKLATQEVSSITGGTLDVLINNAALVDGERNNLPLGGYPEGKEDLLEQDLRKNFDVNVIGPIHTTNAFLPLLRSNPTSSFLRKVITISTGIADLDLTLAINFPLNAPYCISKAALNLAMAKYAAEYKEKGEELLFLSISPGLVATKEVFNNPTGEELKKFEYMVSTFRRVDPDFTSPITPEESVKAVLDVVDKATIEHSGTLVSHKGNKVWL